MQLYKSQPNSLAPIWCSNWNHHCDIVCQMGAKYKLFSISCTWPIDMQKLLCSLFHSHLFMRIIKVLRNRWCVFFCFRTMAFCWQLYWRLWAILVSWLCSLEHWHYHTEPFVLVSNWYIPLFCSLSLSLSGKINKTYSYCIVKQSTTLITAFLRQSQASKVVRFSFGHKSISIGVICS